MEQITNFKMNTAKEIGILEYRLLKAKKRVKIKIISMSIFLTILLVAYALAITNWTIALIGVALAFAFLCYIYVVFYSFNEMQKTTYANIGVLQKKMSELIKLK
ncbi:MAG: hypothetical protein RR322_01835 [Oscillospiraceae bacterium]